MATLPKNEESWFQQAVELVVRQGLTFRQAVVDLGLPLNTQECETIFRRKSFQQLLRAERHRFFQELASDPGATKASAVGSLLVCAAKLMEQESFDKAAEVYLKIAKPQGWVGSDSTVNVFAGLSQADYAKLRQSVASRQTSTGLVPATC